MTYRHIAESELPQVADIQARAFLGDADRYVQSYRDGGRMSWQDLRLYENDRAQPVAAVTLFRRAMSLNGGEVPAGLVGSVAVPPEQRRRGYARRMMMGLLEELYHDGTPVSLLFPFSVAWYRKLGYGLANFNWLMELAPSLIPDFAERHAVRRATAEDRPAIRRCYEAARYRSRNNGWLSRGNWEWEKRLWEKPDYAAVVWERDGEIRGYLVYQLSWNAGRAQGQVIEWVWTDERAWRGLAGFLSALAEQVNVIRYNAPQGDPLLAALPEPFDRPAGSVEFVFFPVARLVSGFMLRVVHLEEALRVRLYPPDITADLLFQVDDDQLPDNNRPLAVHLAGGKANVAVATATQQARLPLLRAPMDIFSQLYTGVTRADQARVAGQLEADNGTCALLTAAFAGAPFHMWSADWF